MEMVETELEGVYLLKCNKEKDKGGTFEQLPELFSTKEIDKSYNNKGALRGLHFQKSPYAQNKIIRCNSGKAVEIVLDIRKDSKTYGEHILIELRPTDMIYMKRGFACGFLSLKDGTSFDYISDNNYDPKYIDTISYDDPSLNIDLSYYMTRYNIKKPIMTEEDRNGKNLKDLDTEFYIKPKKFLITGVIHFQSRLYILTKILKKHLII